MKTDLYQKAKMFMIESLKKADRDISHHQRTVYWLKKLESKPSEALLIAGITHDIERAFYGDWKKGSIKATDINKHQKQSAQIVADFLSKENADPELISRVKELISHHEIGGDREENVLCDADALAVLEQKGLRFVRKFKKMGLSNNLIKKRIDYYYSRIKSAPAQKLAYPWYQKALKIIEREN